MHARFDQLPNRRTIIDRRSLADALAVLLCVAPFGCSKAEAASNQEKPVATFRFSGTSFSLPIPDGYCLPTGRDVDVAQLLAAGDNENVTHLMLNWCEPRSREAIDDDYILIKTPKHALLAFVDRKSFMEAVGVEFDKPDFAAALAREDFTDGAEKSLEETLGSKIDIGGALRPLGKDDVCAYLGGTLEIATPKLAYKISVAGCITSVANRVVTLYWYGPDKGAPGIASLITRVRTLATKVEGHPDE
jgi:hypothetical protein